MGMTQKGFTLLEIIIAVALVGILAAIAVTSFSKQTRKMRGNEAQALFASIRVSEEQYHLENGAYLSTGASESDTWPTSPHKTSQNLLPLPATWTTLKVRLPENTAYCGYVTIAGAANDGSNLGAKAAEFGLAAAPTNDWYYILAHCDLDGNSARDTYYFTSSLDAKIEKQNEGY
jgi:prepilin-type N-terminal cleavage/methylation domain-containing protein